MPKKVKDTFQFIFLLAGVFYLLFFYFKPPFTEKIKQAVMVKIDQLLISTSKENAAAHYLNAFEVQKFPLSRKYEENVMAYISGEKGGKFDLQGLLEDNEKSLEAMEPALKLLKCDFNFGRKETTLPKKPLMFKMKRIVMLVLIRAKEAEKKEDIDEALEQYLMALTVTRHMLQDDDGFTKVMAIELREPIVNRLIKLIQNRKTPVEQLVRVSSYIKDHEKIHFSATEFVASERDRMVKKVERINKFVQKDFSAQSMYELRVLKNSILTESTSVIDRYYLMLERYAIEDEVGYLIQYHFSVVQLKVSTPVGRVFYSEKDIYDFLKDSLKNSVLVGRQEDYPAIGKLIGRLIMLSAIDTDYTKLLLGYRKTSRALASIQFLAESKSDRMLLEGEKIKTPDIWD